MGAGWGRCSPDAPCRAVRGLPAVWLGLRTTTQGATLQARASGARCLRGSKPRLLLPPAGGVLNSPGCPAVGGSPVPLCGSGGNQLPTHASLGCPGPHLSAVVTGPGLLPTPCQATEFLSVLFSFCYVSVCCCHESAGFGTMVTGLCTYTFLNPFSLECGSCHMRQQGPVPTHQLGRMTDAALWPESLGPSSGFPLSGSHVRLPSRPAACSVELEGAVGQFFLPVEEQGGPVLPPPPGWGALPSAP